MLTHLHVVGCIIEKNCVLTVKRLARRKTTNRIFQYLMYIMLCLTITVYDNTDGKKDNM